MHTDRPTTGRRIEECFCCWLKRVNIVCRLNKKMKSYYPVLIQFSASLILNTLPNHLQLALKLIQSSSPRGAVAHGDLRPNDDATNTRPRNRRPTVDCGLAKILRLNMWSSLVNRMPPVPSIPTSYPKVNTSYLLLLLLPPHPPTSPYLCCHFNKLH